MLDLDRLQNFIKNSPVSALSLSYSQEISKDLFEFLHTNINSVTSDYFYWNKPIEKFAFIAISSAFSINQTTHADNLDEKPALNNFKQTYFSNLNLEEQKSFPLFIGSKKFPLNENSSLWNDFSSSEWYIPKYLFLKQNDKYFVSINSTREAFNIESFLSELNSLFAFNNRQNLNNTSSYLELESGNSALSDWSILVEKSLKKISEKELEKVVIARKTEAKITLEIDLAKALSSLESTYPACYIFAIKKNESIFFGATPEKLFRINDNIIETDALAGSIQRGENEIIDKELGQLLLESEKDLNEHNSVRNFLIEKLYNVTDKIEYDCKPKLRKLNNIQHLWTPINAMLKSDFDLFSLIKNLYPTPAICGYPTESALKTISSLEKFDRGLYSGAVGWFNLHNEAEFAVALRSGLIKDNKLTAFAGCGIVTGSDPYLEFKETELKLKPILSLFINEPVNQP